MNEYINQIKPYGVSSHDIWNMNGDERKHCLKLDWNEALVPPSPMVRSKMIELAADGSFYNWYPNTNNSRLIKEIADYVNLEEENIQVFASSDVLHEYVARCWLKHGDKAVILWPTYDNFRATAEAVGAEIIYSILDDFEFNLKKLQGDIESSMPQLVYICNPNNPTGSSIDRETIEKLLKYNKQVCFLVDEAYAEFSGESVSDLVGTYDNLLVSRTFSKAFALANFRIGYLISSKKNIDLISRIRNSKNITTFSQEAAIAALQDVGYMLDYVKNVNIAKGYLYKEMNRYDKVLKIYPSSANFLLVKMVSCDAKRKFLCFMRKNGIYIRDLQQDILAEKFVRITIGTIGQMKYLVEKVRQFEDCYSESGGV